MPAPAAWSNTEVISAAPLASVRVAWSQVGNPPGWDSTMGTNHTATAAAPASTVTPSRLQRLVDPSTARSARITKARLSDWR